MGDGAIFRNLLEPAVVGKYFCPLRSRQRLESR